jgi:hypothetical protein
MLASSLIPGVIGGEGRTRSSVRQSNPNCSVRAIRGDFDQHFVVQYGRVFGRWPPLDRLTFRTTTS